MSESIPGAPLPSRARMEAPPRTEPTVLARGDDGGQTLSATRENAASRGLTLPNLIVIGAQKCGTSGLHYYLGLHPEVSMSTPTNSKTSRSVCARSSRSRLFSITRIWSRS